MHLLSAENIPKDCPGIVDSCLSTRKTARPRSSSQIAAGAGDAPWRISLCRNDWADAHGLRDLQVLAAIGLLGGESSFENISAIVNEWSSIDVESRFVYAAMDRLQDRKLITSHFSDVAKTGNAPKRLFKITPDGQRKLSTAPKQALARVKNDEWDQTDDSAWRAPL